MPEGWERCGAPSVCSHWTLSSLWVDGLLWGVWELSLFFDCWKALGPEDHLSGLLER